MSYALALFVLCFSMRLFIAVNFNDEEKDRILEVRELLRSRALSGNFSRRENFHLTVAFLGETQDKKLESLFGILDEVCFTPFDIFFDRAGRFTRRGAELWWIGAARGSPGLEALSAVQKKLVLRLEEEEFSVDTKPFNAHITLGREIKCAKPIGLDFPRVNVRVERVSLMKSERVRGVLTYTELKREKQTESCF